MTLGPLLVALAWASPARAGTCPAMEGAHPGLADIDATTRLDYLHEAAVDARRDARMWSRGWGLGFVGVTVGQLGLAGLSDAPEDQRTWLVGAASSLIGATNMAVAGPTGPRHLRRLDQLMAEATLDECALLAEAERMLVLDAKGERFGKGWFAHGGNLVVNVAAGLILGLLWDQWEDAFLTVAMGTLVGEVMIWTQPMNREHTREAYLRAAWDEHRGAQLRVAPRLAPGELGLALVGRW